MTASEADRRQRLGAALVCILVGGFLGYAAWTRPDPGIPPAVGVLAALVFGLAGAALFLQALGYTRTAILPIFLLVTAMTGIGAWIGFGSGHRRCRGSLSGLPFVPSEMACRAVFGGGALLTGVIALLILRSMVKGGSNLASKDHAAEPTRDDGHEPS